MVRKWSKACFLGEFMESVQCSDSHLIATMSDNEEVVEEYEEQVEAFLGFSYHVKVLSVSA